MTMLTFGRLALGVLVPDQTHEGEVPADLPEQRSEIRVHQVGVEWLTNAVVSASHDRAWPITEVGVARCAAPGHAPAPGAIGQHRPRKCAQVLPGSFVLALPTLEAGRSTGLALGEPLQGGHDTLAASVLRPSAPMEAIGSPRIWRKTCAKCSGTWATGTYTFRYIQSMDLELQRRVIVQRFGRTSVVRSTARRLRSMQSARKPTARPMLTADYERGSVRSAKQRLRIPSRWRPGTHGYVG